MILGTIALLIEPVRNEIIYAYHYCIEDITDEQKAAMKRTGLGEPASYTAEKDGMTYTMPLPNGATEYPGGGYLVINYEFYGEYFNRLRELEGYEFDQMGGMMFLKSNDDKIRFYVAILNVARRYEHLTVEHYWTNDSQ